MEVGGHPPSTAAAAAADDSDDSLGSDDESPTTGKTTEEIQLEKAKKRLAFAQADMVGNEDLLMKIAVEESSKVFLTGQLPTINWDTTQTVDLSGKGLGGGFRNCFPALAFLKNLTELNLRFNNIVDVSPLALLGDDDPPTKLTKLHLDDNRITDVGPLAGLKELTCLNLGGNQIADVGPLAGLIKLKVLNLRLNNIEDVSPLAPLEVLTELDLSLNPIQD
jgi:Leucine-rich repeat (LRR) protein